MWAAAKFYCKEAERCTKARAYFSAIVARGCELEALLRIFDFVETRRLKDRCKQLHGLINRAFAKHWIPHDALRHWKKAESVPLKTCLHEVREARNGVHAHLFDADWTGKLFQSANRYAHLYFLRMIAGIDAFLVNVYFIDDQHSPTTSQEWKTAIPEVQQQLGLTAPVPFCAELFLDALP